MLPKRNNEATPYAIVEGACIESFDDQAIQKMIQDIVNDIYNIKPSPRYKNSIDPYSNSNKTSDFVPYGLIEDTSTIPKEEFNIKKYMDMIVELTEKEKLKKYEEFIEIGESLKNMRNLQVAIMMYEEAIFYNPKAMQPYLELGVLYSKLDQWEKASQNFKKTIKFGSKTGLFLYGCTLKKLKKYEQAYEVIHKFIDYSSKTNTIVLIELGEICYKLRLYEEAVGHCKNILNLEPYNKKAWRLRELAEKKIEDQKSNDK